MADFIENMIGADTEDYVMRIFLTRTTRQDITGYSGWLMMKTEFDDADSAAVIDVTGSITDAANGEMTFAIPSADTLANQNGIYYFAIKYKTAAGKLKTIGGKNTRVTIEQGVIQRVS